MSGFASWEQIFAILGMLGIVASAAFIGTWRILLFLSMDRKSIEGKIDTASDAIEKRLQALEVFNAGTVVVLEHLKSFREEVQAKHNQLREQRERDMQGLHTRLDAIFNTAQMVRLRNEGLGQRDE